MTRISKEVSRGIWRQKNQEFWLKLFLTPIILIGIIVLTAKCGLGGLH